MKLRYIGSFVLVCLGVSCVVATPPPAQPVALAPGENPPAEVVPSEAASKAPPAAPSAPTYQDVGPIRCEGNGSGNQQGVRISADTGAVVISGNCEYTLSDCEISAKTQAVNVAGNGRLTLERCQIRGAAALVASGNAEIAVKDSVVFGTKQTRGNAQIRDVGGNQFSAK